MVEEALYAPRLRSSVLLMRACDDDDDDDMVGCRRGAGVCVCGAAEACAQPQQQRREAEIGEVRVGVVGPWAIGKSCGRLSRCAALIGRATRAGSGRRPAQRQAVCVCAWAPACSVHTLTL